MTGTPSPPLLAGSVTKSGVTSFALPISGPSAKSKLTRKLAATYGAAMLTGFGVALGAGVGAFEGGVDPSTYDQSYTPRAGFTSRQLITKLAPHNERSRPMTLSRDVST